MPVSVSVSVSVLLVSFAFFFVQNGVCIQVIATGRRGHVVSSRQGQDGEDLTVEVEGVGVRSLKPRDVRPLPPNIVRVIFFFK